jgi:hypothetical protein
MRQRKNEPPDGNPEDLRCNFPAQERNKIRRLKTAAHIVPALLGHHRFVEFESTR